MLSPVVTPVMRLEDDPQALRALVEAAPVPMVVISPDATVRLWNPAAEHVFGWREAEVVGQPIPTRSHSVYSDGPGRGAEFVVTLPALTAPGSAPTSRAMARVEPPGRTDVVLIEDNPDAAESLMMLLELLGHQVRLFRDGLSALAAASASPPDVMVVDIGLPGIDGYEVARRARACPELERVVLIALTGYGREEDKCQATAAGFDHHLVKPVEPSALEGLVAELAKRADVAGSALH